MFISCVVMPCDTVRIVQSFIFFLLSAWFWMGGQGAGAKRGGLPIHIAPFPVSSKMGFVLQLHFVFMEFFLLCVTPVH